MANSARIHRGGKFIYLFLDPASGTLTQPASVTGSLDDIEITASGGAVTVSRVAFRKKYPFVDLNTNQFKVCVKLSRRIKCRETVTIDIPGFVSDGTRTNATSTGLSVTNNSGYYDDGDINDILDSDAKIIYVDPTGGDDTLAAAINSGDGYYTLGANSGLIGADAARPTGSVQAYATLGAVNSVISDEDHAVIFLKRGETFDGTTQFMTPLRMLNTLKSGESATHNLIFAAYGSGTDLVELVPVNNSSLGRRVFNTNTGSTPTRYVILGYGLDIQPGTSNSGISVNVDNQGLTGTILFLGCKAFNVGAGISGSNDGSLFVSDIGIVKCWIDNANTTSGLQTSSDFDDYPQREWFVEECVLRKLGSSSLEHPFYPKHFGDLLINDCLFDDNSGSGGKLDMCWGVDFSGNVFTRTGAAVNIEGNGTSDAGAPTDRSEDTETNEYPVPANAEGAYAKWVNFDDNLLTDECGAMVGKYGPAYYSSVKNNLFVTELDAIINSCAYQNDGGSGSGGYTRDSWGLETENNTFVAISTTTSQVRLIQFNCATTDTFDGPTNNNSKGHHEFLIRRNVLYIGSGVTSGQSLIRVADDAYADAKAAGRADGSFALNCGYKQGGSQTDMWADDSDTNYSTVAAWETAIGSDATGNRFEDPGFTDLGYQVGDWATAEGYTDLDDYSLTIAQGVVNDTIDLVATIADINATIRPKYLAGSLSAANYGGELPGIALLEAPAATLSITDTDGNPLDDPEVINATQSGTPGTWSVRINAADADWDTSLDGVVVGISSIGSVVNSTESDGTTPFTIGTGTVSAGDYIIVNGEFNYSSAGTFNPVRLTIEGGDGAANDVTQDWNITVAPSPGFLKTGVRSVRSVRSVRGVR